MVDWLGWSPRDKNDHHAEPQHNEEGIVVVLTLGFTHTPSTHTTQVTHTREEAYDSAGRPWSLGSVVCALAFDSYSSTPWPSQQTLLSRLSRSSEDDKHTSTPHKQNLTS